MFIPGVCHCVFFVRDESVTHQFVTCQTLHWLKEHHFQSKQTVWQAPIKHNKSKHMVISSWQHHGEDWTACMSASRLLLQTKRHLNQWKLSVNFCKLMEMKRWCCKIYNKFSYREKKVNTFQKWYDVLRFLLCRLSLFFSYFWKSLNKKPIFRKNTKT